MIISGMTAPTNIPQSAELRNITSSIMAMNAMARPIRMKMRGIWNVLRSTNAIPANIVTMNENIKASFIGRL
tara:strand:+ start:582 stop:797 length:216 start_codon:yes stop_codon:yes gene_type:complete